VRLISPISNKDTDVLHSAQVQQAAKACFENILLKAAPLQVKQEAKVSYEKLMFRGREVMGANTSRGSVVYL
jgi:hypothetical protein